MTSASERLRIVVLGYLIRGPRFIQDSAAEFGIAKEAYVVTRSGWFSERSACYLASARPVVLQDTGFSDWLPTGDGVLAFETPAEAVARIRALHERYDDHCQAARAVAEEYFDSARVLSKLLDDAFSTRTTGAESLRRARASVRSG